MFESVTQLSLDRFFPSNHFDFTIQNRFFLRKEVP